MAFLLSILNKIFPGHFTPPLPDSPPAPVVPVVPPAAAYKPSPPFRDVSHALATIYAAAGLERTSTHNPSAAKVEQAWTFLQEPVRSYIRALVFTKKTYPLWRGQKQSYAKWLADLEVEAANDHDTVIGAIIKGAEFIVATGKVTTVLADRARLRGETYLDLSNQGEIELKVHVLAEPNRPLFLRCRQTEGEPVKLLDHGENAKLAITTRDGSGWRCEDGWLVPAGPGRKKPSASDNGGNLPTEKLTPPDGKKPQ